MENEIIQYEPEKIQLPILENKIIEVGSLLINHSAHNRDEGRRIRDLIYNEIAELKQEHEKDLEEYRVKYDSIMAIEDCKLRFETLKYLPKPRRPAITFLLAELNRALEVTVISSDNIVKFVDALAKIKAAKKNTDEFDEIKYVGKRAELLDKIKEKRLNEPIA